MNPLIIGSRGSPLALAQVTLIKSLLPGVPIETVIIKTSGDKFLEVSLAAAGGISVAEPFAVGQIQPASLDLRLGKRGHTGSGCTSKTEAACHRLPTFMCLCFGKPTVACMCRH